jgi:RNA polymerase-binding protein DksA
MAQQQIQQGIGQSRYTEGLDVQSVQARLLALHRELERGTQNGEDPADSATRPEDLVVGWVLQSGNVDKLAQVKAALARLEAGTYGTCADCDGPINPARLEARPFATRCVNCQQRADRQGPSRAGWGGGSQWLASQ